MDCKTLMFFKRKSKQNGTISIEFIMAVPILFILLFFFLEMCRMIAICAVIDLAIADSGRYTARKNITTGEYKEAFIKHLKSSKSLFNYFLPLAYDSAQGIDINVTYCASIQDVISNKCSNNSSLKFAIYNINYNYKPLFLPLPSMIKNKISFHRDIVYVQEALR